MRDRLRTSDRFPNGCWIPVCRRLHQFTLHADEDGPQIKTCKRLPIDIRDARATKRTRAGDNAADQTTRFTNFFRPPLLALCGQQVQLVTSPLSLYTGIGTGASKPPKRIRQLRMTKGCEHVRHMMTEKADKNRILDVTGHRLAFINGVTYRYVRMKRPALGHSPARYKCQSFDRHRTSAPLDIDPLNLLPSSVQRLFRTVLVVASLCFRNRQVRKIRIANDPVREVSARVGRAPDDLNATWFVKDHRHTSEMHENGQLEVSLKIRPRHESAQQP